MLSGFKEGQDLTIMNTQYHYPSKLENGTWSKGAIDLVFKDNATNTKHIQTIVDPTYDFYVIKEDEFVDHNLFFIEKEKVDMVTAPYNLLEKEIATITKNTEFYYDNIKSGNRRSNALLHTHNRIMNSDMNIEDFYRYKFSKTYVNNITPISKAFYDIEADTRNMKGDFPEMGECPINAVTYIDKDDKMIYTLLLRNPENPLIEEFEKNVSSHMSELKNLIKETVGVDKDGNVKFGLGDFKHQFVFYDVEINLVKDLFNIINVKQPDFVLAWNMGFDQVYIIERVIKLGYKPEDIMCHPDFDIKVSKYHIDERALNEFAQRGDYAKISSYSVFLDQMIQFASRRKGQSMFDSFSLDNIGKVVANVRKLDYSHITTDITEFPWLDYKLFVFYNIVDTIVQLCIEETVEDIDYVFAKSVSNHTRYSKIHRQTVYLVNRGVDEFFKDGYIMGNNVNKQNEKKGKFPGAFVADPTRISNFNKVKINDSYINLYKNAVDYDYKSLYPSLIKENNMAPNTQIGMILIEDKIHDLENRSGEDVERFSRGGAFLEDISSNNHLEFCHRWLKLGTYKDLYNDVNEIFTTKIVPYNPIKTFDVVSGFKVPFNPSIKEYKVPFYEESRKELPDLKYIKMEELK